MKKLNDTNPRKNKVVTKPFDGKMTTTERNGKSETEAVILQKLGRTASVKGGGK